MCALPAVIRTALEIGAIAGRRRAVATGIDDRNGRIGEGARVVSTRRSVEVRAKQALASDQENEGSTQSS
jgi:hypothetical protein